MANKRSVVVFGVSGCGKSTICNKLLGEYKFDIVEGFSTGTTEMSEGTKEVDYGDKKLNITVIDTVGLSDAHRPTDDGISAIQQKIKAIGGLNLILFVIKFQRLTDAETKVLKIIDENMKGTINAYSAVVITGCENLDEVDRSKAVEKLQRDSLTKNLAASMAKGIYTVGFPDTKIYPETVKSYFNGVMESDREKLLKLVYEAKQWYRYDEIFNVSCLDYLRQTCKAIIEFYVTPVVPPTK